jgi:hypothetical protein
VSGGADGKNCSEGNEESEADLQGLHLCPPEVLMDGSTFLISAVEFSPGA